MNKISVKKNQFSQKSLEPKVSSNYSLNFSMIPPQNLKQKSSFNSELRKITSKVGPIMEKNSFKILNVGQENKGLPFKRRARSSSPPKDELKVLNREINLFPCGAPVVPIIQNQISYVEDDELKKIKQDYLKLIQSAQESKAIENDDFWDEEEAYIESIINSLSFARLKQV